MNPVRSCKSRRRNRSCGCPPARRYRACHLIVQAVVSATLLCGMFSRSPQAEAVLGMVERAKLTDSWERDIELWTLDGCDDACLPLTGRCEPDIDSIPCLGLHQRLRAHQLRLPRGPSTTLSCHSLRIRGLRRAVHTPIRLDFVLWRAWGMCTYGATTAWRHRRFLCCLGRTSTGRATLPTTKYRNLNDAI